MKDAKEILASVRGTVRMTRRIRQAREPRQLSWAECCDEVLDECRKFVFIQPDIAITCYVEFKAAARSRDTRSFN